MVKFISKISVMFNSIPPPFPDLGKGGGSGGYTSVTPPENRTARAVSQGQAAGITAVLYTLDRQLLAVLNNIYAATED